jgi:hypothetical protein
LQKRIWQLNSENKYFTVDDLLQYAKEELEYAGAHTSIKSSMVEKFFAKGST